MTPEQFRAAIAKLGLSQERAGVWLGVSPRQGRRYARGVAKIPLGFARLLRLMVRLGVGPDDAK